MASFTKKSKVKANIPTSSMPDIIFMLLIFFMATTVMRQYDGLKVRYPDAKKATKIKLSKRHLLSLWIDKRSRVVLNEHKIPSDDLGYLGKLVGTLMFQNPKYKVLIKMDEEAEMGVLSDVVQQLRKGQALNIFYITRLKE